VLTEALAPAHRAENSNPPAEKSPRPTRNKGELQPAAMMSSDGGQQ
jgi:hypothetical protein